jgi:hypothetical protein
MRFFDPILHSKRELNRIRLEGFESIQNMMKISDDSNMAILRRRNSIAFDPFSLLPIRRGRKFSGSEDRG